MQRSGLLLLLSVVRNRLSVADVVVVDSTSVRQSLGGGAVQWLVFVGGDQCGFR